MTWAQLVCVTLWSVTVPALSVCVCVCRCVHPCVCVEASLRERVTSFTCAHLDIFSFFITVNVAWKLRLAQLFPKHRSHHNFSFREKCCKMTCRWWVSSFFFLFLSCSFFLCISLSLSQYLSLSLRGPIYSLKCFRIFTLSIWNVPVLHKITHSRVCH